jgi:predicted translin family RNA/ssDNA-binding protein
MHIDDIIKYVVTKGDLNYLICQIVGNIILRDDYGISYQAISEWIDGVHDAECELRRRILENYEDQKIIENGDVSSFMEIISRMRE